MADIKQPIDTLAKQIGNDIRQVWARLKRLETNTVVVTPPSIWPITPIELLPPDPAGPLPAWAIIDTPAADLTDYTPVDLQLACLDYNLFDLQLNTGLDIATDSSLDTAILISLFTDRYDQETKQGGWWGDDYVGSSSMLGSRLWLLNKSKVDVQTLRNAENYAREALQWLLDDKLLTNLTINCQWVRGDANTNNYRLRLLISALYQTNSHYRSSLARSYLL